MICTHHATDYDRPKWGRFGRWFLKTGERMMAMFADEVICVSSWIETQLANEYPEAKERLVTIRNGAPPAVSGDSSAEGLLASLGLEKDNYILCVGRLDPSKAFHDVVRAFELAKPRDLKLVIVGGSMGSDEYAAELKAFASDTVVFAGPRSAEHVRTLYKSAALFVHPSYQEGFAMVVLEALAADAPILLSNIPAHLEAGLDPQSYFPRGDVPALAAQFMTGDYTRLRCSRRSEILEENDWDTVARRHRDVLIGGRRDRRDGDIQIPAV